ncbi:MAG: hypothetical protein EPO20_24080 [Betaproteobacteria bacterium]|nr:MAG: hypothetical protein EPO20_24080 [Betaproteobacteria bacterium]
MNVETLLQMVSAAALIIAGYWGLTKFAIWSFNRSLDERFAALENARREGRQQWAERMEKNDAKIEELERDVRKILIELPREYVTRADYVRRETVIEAKIDQLSLRIQNWILEGKNA